MVTKCEGFVEYTSFQEGWYVCRRIFLPSSYVRTLPEMYLDDE